MQVGGEKSKKLLRKPLREVMDRTSFKTPPLPRHVTQDQLRWYANYDVPQLLKAVS